MPKTPKHELDMIVKAGLRDEKATFTVIAALLRNNEPLQHGDGATVGLNMQSIVSEGKSNPHTPGCNTTACVAGLAAMVENPRVTVHEAEQVGMRMAMSSKGPLKDLFYVRDKKGDMHLSDKSVQNRPDLVAEAIDNYLNGMKHPWQPILENLGVVKIPVHK